MLDAGDRELVARAIDEGQEELAGLRRVRPQLAPDGSLYTPDPRTMPSHPLRRFEAYERALERAGFVIARRP